VGEEHPGAARRWWELTIAASAETSEALTNLLWEIGALGVVEEETPGAAPRLSAFFPDTAVPAELEATVRAYLADLARRGFAVADAPRVTPLVDARWAEAWREHFRPVAVGRRLVVVPPWERTPADGRLAIVIEPGRAFGTGHHGSTAGCLVALEAIADAGPPPRAIDLGTGSGVLAVAAAKLGVPDVLAVDEDPDAVAAAEGNAARNGVADRVRCRLADAATLDARPAPLVLANLLSAAHHRFAARYATLVAAEGALVLGGILDVEADAVRIAVARAGFTPADAVLLEGWTALVLRRAPAHAPVHVRA
jgi:ribosomal protein L11 methyltransferase